MGFLWLLTFTNIKSPTPNLPRTGLSLFKPVHPVRVFSFSSCKDGASSPVFRRGRVGKQSLKLQKVHFFEQRTGSWPEAPDCHCYSRLVNHNLPGTGVSHFSGWSSPPRGSNSVRSSLPGGLGPAWRRKAGWESTIVRSAPRPAEWTPMPGPSP